MKFNIKCTSEISLRFNINHFLTFVNHVLSHFYRLGSLEYFLLKEHRAAIVWEPIERVAISRIHSVFSKVFLDLYSSLVYNTDSVSVFYKLSYLI
jgi:hypothetical protein